jgi:hypothetical protein
LIAGCGGAAAGAAGAAEDEEVEAGVGATLIDRATVGFAIGAAELAGDGVETDPGRGDVGGGGMQGEFGHPVHGAEPLDPPAQDGGGVAGLGTFRVEAEHGPGHGAAQLGRRLISGAVEDVVFESMPEPGPSGEAVGGLGDDLDVAQGDHPSRERGQRTRESAGDGSGCVEAAPGGIGREP